MRDAMAHPAHVTQGRFTLNASYRNSLRRIPCRSPRTAYLKVSQLEKQNRKCHEDEYKKTPPGTRPVELPR
jgi:hypothetical protein